MSVFLRQLVLFAALLLMLGACGKSKLQHTTVIVTATGKKVNLANTVFVKQVLYEQYQAWKGVPYREGGGGRKGIDCSGFVYVTFREKFGRIMPRTTKGQSTLGSNIGQKSLQAGDLVFFKTGFFTKHVGIFIENRNFMHASTSKGVMISSLDNVYWSDKYWMAKRL